MSRRILAFAATILTVTLGASCTATTMDDPDIALGVTLNYLEGVSVYVDASGPLEEQILEAIDTDAIRQDIQSRLRKGGLLVLPLDVIEMPLVGSSATLRLTVSAEVCGDRPDETVLRMSMTLDEVVTPARDPDTVFILTTWSLDSERSLPAGEGFPGVEEDARMLADSFLEDFVRANPDATVGPAGAANASQ